ncbi:MAG: metallophosphoesterase [Bacteroidota bacterium]|nr:metallophosphoesterase [Bacteroidota bacterium]
MRILAFTDIHGSYSTVEEILARESARGLDVVLLGGDLTTNGTQAEARGAVSRFQKFGKPVLAVAGNMDPVELEETFTAIGGSVNAQGKIIGAVGFFGVSGAPLSFLHTPYEISEEEILRRAETGWNEVKSARWKIFVPHAPPFNTHVDKIFAGRHVGSTSVRKFIEEKQPDAVVCGHIHEARGTDTIGKAIILNCGQAGKGLYAVVTITNTLHTELAG